MVNGAGHRYIESLKQQVNELHAKWSKEKQQNIDLNLSLEKKAVDLLQRENRKLKLMLRNLVCETVEYIQCTSKAVADIEDLDVVMKEAEKLSQSKG